MVGTSVSWLRYKLDFTEKTLNINCCFAVFGKVFDNASMDIVRKIEKLQTDDRDRPSKAVVIKDSGTLPVDEREPEDL